MTLFILTHIKLFFIVFRTNYWTDVVAGRVRPSVGEQAAETWWVQSNIVRKEFSLRIWAP